MTDIDQSSTVSTPASGHHVAVTDDRTTRWAPAWVGAVVALPVFLLLQLLFIAFGWIALGVDGAGAGTAASIVSAVLAIIALFVGGFAGGMASSWHGTSTNTALQGVMSWALTSLALFGFGLFGAGAVIGNMGRLTQLVATAPQQFQPAPGAAAAVIDSVQYAAGWGALWLVVALVAAVLGTGMGAATTKGAGAPRGGRSSGGAARH